MRHSPPKKGKNRKWKFKKESESATKEEIVGASSVPSQAW